MEKFTEVNITQKVTRKRYLVNAEGKILGRLAQEIAKLLRGKEKVPFSYHQDFGDSVVVYNAEKIRVTGDKRKTKVYTRYSGYPGGLRKTTLEELLKKQPEKVIQHAVHGMLPKSSLGKKIFKKLRVYRGEKLPFPTKHLEVLEIS